MVYTLCRSNNGMLTLGMGRVALKKRGLEGAATRSPLIVNPRRPITSGIWRAETGTSALPPECSVEETTHTVSFTFVDGRVYVRKWVNPIGGSRGLATEWL